MNLIESERMFGTENLVGITCLISNIKKATSVMRAAVMNIG
jgi:hypothetical protein